MLPWHWVLCSFAIEYYAHLPLSIMLICHRVLCSFAIEYYAPLTSSIMLLRHWVLCSFAIEYYAPLPLSIMLICHRVLCSFAIEYYAHSPSSIMLIRHRALCSFAIEYYAHLPLSIMLICHWVLCYSDGGLTGPSSVGFSCRPSMPHWCCAGGCRCPCPWRPWRGREGGRWWTPPWRSDPERHADRLPYPSDELSYNSDNCQNAISKNYEESTGYYTKLFWAQKNYYKLVEE